MFRLSDWALTDKAFESGSAIAVGLTHSGETLSGAWSHDQIWTTLGISQLMMVSSGSSGIVPAEEVEYLVESGAVTGRYLTPAKQLVKDPNIVQPGPNQTPQRPIPEPMSVALFGLGLTAVAWRVRRRRR
jgi:hypothetical protein